MSHERNSNIFHKKGKLFIFSSPSGAGKSTIVKYLLEEFPNLKLSISVTTRKPRKNEINGVHYKFISINEFNQLRLDNQLLEWEEVYPNQFYGTQLYELKRIWDSKCHVVFDIDVEGGLKIKDKFPKETIAIFIYPPSIDVIEERLIKRKSETEQSLKIRIEKASEEMRYAKFFDVILWNDNLDDAKRNAKKIIQKFIESE